jgi:hypothetical protein
MIQYMPPLLHHKKPLKPLTHRLLLMDLFKWGLIGTTILGLGCTGKNAIKPKPVIDSVPAARSTLISYAHSQSLADSVNATINDFYKRPKPTGDVTQLKDGEKSPDFNLDHVVGFDDFFLFADAFSGEDPDYDLTGDGKVDFNDFFAFADYFGMTVNQRPYDTKVESSIDGVIQPGDMASFMVSAKDAESDSLSFQWFVNGILQDYTGNKLERSFTEAGSYTVAVKAVDESGASSDLVELEKFSVNAKPYDVTIDSSVDGIIAPGTAGTFTAFAKDPDGDSLTYEWYVAGIKQNETGKTFTKTFSTSKEYTVGVKAVDSNGAKSDLVELDPIVVNSAPVLESLVASSGSVDPDESFTLTANATDDDTMKYKWTRDGVDLNFEGSELTDAQSVGRFTYTVTAVDSHGQESSTLEKTVVVEDVKPVLTIDPVISIVQYTAGMKKGNVFEVLLDTLVQDPKYSDSELVWDIEVLENRFSHTKENTPIHTIGMMGYSADALIVTKEGHLVEFDPVANYNSTKHGTREVVFKVTNPDGKTASDTVTVDVKRDNTFDTLYDRVVTGGGWITMKPHTAYIWVGNTFMEPDGIDPTTWSGPKVTQEQIENFEEVIGRLHDVSDYFNPLKIVYIDENDADLIYFPNGSPIGNRKFKSPDGSILLLMDDNVMRGTTGTGYDRRKIVFARVSLNPDPTMGTKKTTEHEIYTHFAGMNHPINTTPEDSGETIFTGGAKVFTNQDMAIIDSFYEVVESNMEYIGRI